MSISKSSANPQAEAAFWSLLHIKTETQIDSLTFTQIALLVATFDAEEYDNWAAWYEGEEKWKLLSKHLDTLKITKRTKLYKAQPAPSDEVERDFQTSSEIVKLDMPEMMGADSRMTKRFIKNYKVYIAAGGESYTGATKDISLTGLRLEKGLPLTVGGNVSVTLVNKKGESIELLATVINDRNNDRLKIIRAGKLDVLQAWLLDPKS